jgi:hypothetical protein
MKLIFGMPEILIIFSGFMFSQSWGFAIVAFSLGVLARVSTYALTIAEKKEQQKESEETIENLAKAWKGIFKPEKDA